MGRMETTPRGRRGMVGAEAKASRVANQAMAAEETTAAAVAEAKKEQTHIGKSNLENLGGIVGNMAVITATTDLNANSKPPVIIHML